MSQALQISNEDADLLLGLLGKYIKTEPNGPNDEYLSVAQRLFDAIDDPFDPIDSGEHKQGYVL
jgi:hypothetical protein